MADKKKVYTHPSASLPQLHIAHTGGSKVVVAVTVAAAVIEARGSHCLLVHLQFLK